MQPPPLGKRQLGDRLARFPTESLGFFPTPLVELKRLSERLGGPRILMKREDLSGLALAGNKVRMLEYVLGEARRQGSDTLIAGGGRSQSNHGRLCAAAARACGMRPLIVLSEDPHLPRTMQANLLTQYLLGAEVHLLPSSEIRAEAGPRFGLAHVMEELAERVRREGGRPYVLPTSSVPLATLGFVAAAIELSEQLEALRISRASLYMTSTGSTQAGLLIGAAALGEPWSVVGVACAPAHAPERNVCRLANGAAELLGLPHRVAESEVLNHDYSGGGYGIVDEGAQEALELLARSEGVLLDPVYSAKGMAGLIDHIRSGRLGVDDVVVFVHTGGTPTTFAYADRLAGSADYFASTGTAQLQEDSA